MTIGQPYAVLHQCTCHYGTINAEIPLNITCYIRQTLIWHHVPVHSRECGSMKASSFPTQNRHFKVLNAKCSMLSIVVAVAVALKFWQHRHCVHRVAMSGSTNRSISTIVVCLPFGLLVNSAVLWCVAHHTCSCFSKSCCQVEANACNFCAGS